MHFTPAQQEKYMRLAMEQVEEAISRKGNPWGAVLVDERGEVIAAASNTSTPQTDIVRHAELNILRAANKKPANKNFRAAPYL